MNSPMPNPGIAAATLVLLMLAACVTTPKPDGASAVRAKLTQLQSDPQLAGHAPVAFKQAESAVRQAEVPTDDIELGRHRVVMADRKVEIARAEAQSHFAEDQRKALGDQRDAARLDSRTREADNARADANIARDEADAARGEADAARDEADSARDDADAARMDTEAAEQHIAELNARATDRGLVVTLGDVLFTSGASDLKGGTQGNLDKLSAFLIKYPDRTVVIEGHTDSVGSADSNLGLSQRRAEAVKSYLVGQGVASDRLTAAGKGEGSPAADNDSAGGRQQNRRVEVIISNKVASLR